MPTTTILPRRCSASTIGFHRGSNDVVKLRAHGFERGEFDVENFAGLGQMIHGLQNAGGTIFFQTGFAGQVF